MIEKPSFGVFYANGWGASAFCIQAVPKSYEAYEQEFHDAVVQVCQDLERDEPGFVKRAFGVDAQTLSSLSLGVQDITAFEDPEMILDRVSEMSPELNAFIEHASQESFRFALAERVSEKVFGCAMKHWDSLGDVVLEGDDSVQIDDALLQNDSVLVDLRYDTDTGNVFVVADLKSDVHDMLSELSRSGSSAELITIYQRAMDTLAVNPTLTPCEDKARALINWAEYVASSSDPEMTQEFEDKFGAWALVHRNSDDLLQMGRIQDKTGYDLDGLRALADSVSQRLRTSMARASHEQGIKVYEWSESAPGREVAVELAPEAVPQCDAVAGRSLDHGSSFER